MILGHIDQEILDAHQTQERVRQEQTKRQMGDARSRIRDKVHHAVEERLKGFYGKGLKPESLAILKELAWAVTDENLMMSAAMNQAHTAEELARMRQEDRELWSLLRDPQVRAAVEPGFRNPGTFAALQFTRGQSRGNCTRIPAQAGTDRSAGIGRSVAGLEDIRKSAAGIR